MGTPFNLEAVNNACVLCSLFCVLMLRGYCNSVSVGLQVCVCGGGGGGGGGERGGGGTWILNTSYSVKYVTSSLRNHHMSCL